MQIGVWGVGGPVPSLGAAKPRCGGDRPVQPVQGRFARAEAPTEETRINLLDEPPMAAPELCAPVEWGT